LGGNSSKAKTIFSEMGYDRKSYRLIFSFLLLVVAGNTCIAKYYPQRRPYFSKINGNMGHITKQKKTENPNISYRKILIESWISKTLNNLAKVTTIQYRSGAIKMVAN